VSLVKRRTKILQAAAGNSAALPGHSGRDSIGIEGFYGHGRVTENKSDVAVDLARPLARANYFYARLNFERLTRLPGDFSRIIQGSGQIANGQWN
jgi:hypothetical protein